MKKIVILSILFSVLLLAPLVLADVYLPPGPPRDMSEYIVQTLHVFDLQTMETIGWKYTDGPVWDPETQTEYNKTEKAIKHALAVEAVMRHIARKRGEDEEKWGVVGLIHDLDFKIAPEQHCAKTQEILRERAWPDEYIRAAVSHAWGTFSDAEPTSEMEKVLYAIDELTGLVAATALVRPSKSIMDTKVKSVKKKWKDKSFAAGANREDIEQGAAALGVELSEHIGIVLEALQGIAAELELDGRLAKG